MSKKVLPLLIALLFFSSSFGLVSAKRLLPRLATKTTTSKAISNTKGVTTTVKFRSDRKAIVATFTNLAISTNVSYTLTYSTNGTTQGVGGSILPGASEPVVREMLFGSCSNGICRYDKNVTNARLVVVTTLKNGKKISKSFKLKV